MKYILQNLYITIFVFIVMILVSWASNFINLDALNPVQNMFADFDATDVVFSRNLRADDDPDVLADTNIVMVNAGNLSRGELSQVIATLNEFEPKAIGIDFFFRRLKQDTLGMIGDSMMANALANVKNLVLVSELPNDVEKHLNQTTGEYDTLETSNDFFMTKANTGFADLITGGDKGQINTCRTFQPFASVKGKDGKMKQELAFAVKMAEFANPDAVKRLVERNNKIEYINFRGNIQMVNDTSRTGVFPQLDWLDVLNRNFTPDLIRGKLVYIGFMGPSLQEYSYNDNFCTPMNRNYVGRATPDMYGVVIHANITSMVMHENYIDTTPWWLNLIFNFIFAYIVISIFSYFFRNAGYWYDAITLFSQAFVTIVLTGILVYTFEKYHLKIDVTVAILFLVLAGFLIEMYYGIFTKSKR